MRRPGNVNAGTTVSEMAKGLRLRSMKFAFNKVRHLTYEISQVSSHPRSHRDRLELFRDINWDVPSLHRT